MDTLIELVGETVGEICFEIVVGAMGLVLGSLFDACTKTRASNPDRYKTFKDMSDALKVSGFEVCDLVLAIDFTRSNETQGAKTFGGKDLHARSTLTHFYPSLHATAAASAPPPPAYAEEGFAAAASGHRSAEPVYQPLPDVKVPDSAAAPPPPAATWKTPWSALNPYEQVLSTMSRAVRVLSADSKIYAIGFGDMLTSDSSVFCISKRAAGLTDKAIIKDIVRDCEPCSGVDELLDRYTKAAARTSKSGPTSFVPAIQQVQEMTRKTGRHCMLVIIGDGAMSDEKLDADAVTAASEFPISISMIGVGDGPWDVMEKFDDQLDDRKFDNFQFVDFHRKMNECGNDPDRFALLSLMELPDQVREIKRLGLLSAVAETAKAMRKYA